MSPRLVVTIIASLAVAGCADTPDAASRTAPMSGAIALPVPRYVPPPDRFVQSSLLNFDTQSDTTFVDTRELTLAADPDRPGNRALRASAATIKLGALVRGREFPGAWDLVGVRVRSASGGRCSISLGGGASRAATPAAPTVVTLRPNEWTPAWLELSALAATRPADAEGATLAIRSLDGTPLLIDDVAIAQSRIVVSDSHVPQSGETWQVRRSGLNWQVLVAGQEVYSLPAAPFVEDGYRVVEAGPTRAVFANGKNSVTTIDRTGRLIENGVAKLDPRVLKVAKAIAENASPAKIEIVGDQGRIERSLPGDRDNDGYDEMRGCYTVHATAGRARVRLTRQRATVKWPVIEVFDLPPGTVSVWLEGQTVPWAVRLSDGRAVIELPIELERPVEIEVRVK